MCNNKHHKPTAFPNQVSQFTHFKIASIDPGIPLWNSVPDRVLCFEYNSTMDRSMQIHCSTSAIFVLQGRPPRCLRSQPSQKQLGKQLHVKFCLVGS